MKLSAVVLTKNEEDRIEKCIKSLTFCEEIVVIDDFSTDGTVDKIKKLKSKSQKYKPEIKIFKRNLGENFSEQRNFGIKKARGDWVLFVDVDEVVSSALRKEIKEVVENEDHDGYYLKRVDKIWGGELKYGESGNIRLLRLARKNSGRWKRKVHEYWNVSGKTAILDNHLIHYPHQSIREFVSEISNYSKLHAVQNYKEGKRSNVIKIIFYPIFKFKFNYILKLGFLDGIPGFVAAVIMSFHSFLSWSNLWFLQHKK